ncbi:MAG TPA: hypothetical protein VF658_04215 [Pyrinomonadaceae bacterium]|jgi:hypothetical protein
MVGAIIGSLILLFISIYSWHLVFNESARRKYQEPGALFFRLNKEEREINDAQAMAASLIVGIVSGVFFLALLAFGITRLFQ